MLAILKKVSSTRKNELGAPWRVDFRDLETLPDTKAVRTDFLVNILLFTLLGSLLIFFTHREITLSGLKDDITLVQSQIADTSTPNLTAETNFRDFLSEEKKIKDMHAWAVSPFSFPDYLIHLASLMPSGVRASRIQYQGFPEAILVSGSVEGQNVSASETASEFIASLQQDERFKELFASVTNSNLGRNASTGTLSFELIFTFAKPDASRGIK
jgi:hypothetical protein